MKKYRRSSSAIRSSSAAIDYDRHYTYNKNGQRYTVYTKYEDDPENFQFSIYEIHPYDEAEYAWAKKNAPGSLDIVRDGYTESTLPVPEWDWDMYDDEREYCAQVIDVACAALEEANRDVEPMMSHL